MGNRSRNSIRIANQIEINNTQPCVITMDTQQQQPLHDLQTKTNNQITIKTNFNKQNLKIVQYLHQIEFGRALVVQDITTKKRYVMKQLSKQQIINSHKQEGVLREFKILSQLNHQFILNLHFAFQDHSSLFLVQDYIQGGDLQNTLKHNVFSEAHTKFIFGNLFLILEYIHGKNILHLNVQPEHILVEKSGYLRLTSWKMALHADKFHQTHYNFDVYDFNAYTAPEILLREQPQPYSDYYSLGLILYQIIVGKVPYSMLSGADNGAMMDSTNKNQYYAKQSLSDLIKNKQLQIKKSDLPEGWSLEAADFINKLIQRKPINRLGYNGINEVKKHKWVRDIPWQKIQTRTMVPSFKIKGGIKYWQQCIQMIKFKRLKEIKYDNRDKEFDIDPTFFFKDYYFCQY